MKPAEYSQKRHIADLAYKLKTDILVHSGIKETYPCDPIELARYFGVDIRFHSYSHDQGRLLRYGDRWTMMVSREAPQEVRRFSCAHELGHFFLNSTHRTFLDKLSEIASSDYNIALAEERFCNQFAIELLMPKERVLPFLEKSGKLAMNMFEQLLSLFGCSIQATALRIAALSTWYGFVFARMQNDSDGTYERLAIEWAAAPHGVFLPKHKTISKSSPIWHAYHIKGRVGMPEMRPLNRLRGLYFTEAVAVGVPHSVFAILHLSDDPKLFKPFLIEAVGLHASRQTAENAQWKQLRLWE